jgi:hypothetical protein
MVNKRLNTWGETKSLCGRMSWMDNHRLTPATGETPAHK